MPRTLRKPLWRWEPAPYVLVVVLVVVTSALQPRDVPVLYWTFFALTLASVVLLVAAIIASARRRARAPWTGILRSLDGMRLIEVDPSGGLPTPVVDTHRHQSAIGAAASWGSATLLAVLIPDATRWLGLRIRVAVHLVADGHVYHVGFLPDQATVRFNDRLRMLAAADRFALVPVALAGVPRSATPALGDKPAKVTVALDLGGLAEAVDLES